MLTIPNPAQYMSVFPRRTVFGNEIITTRSTIIFPKEFYESTITMCNSEKETRGVLLCEAITENAFFVKCSITLGQGTAVEVFPNNAKLTAINQLLGAHEGGIIPIDWHTHTVHTGCFESFSSDDFVSLCDVVTRTQRDRMHVLFTPTSVITWGVYNPRFVVLEETNPKVMEDFNLWNRRFNNLLGNIT